jgi:hypothetical protein
MTCFPTYSHEQFHQLVRRCWRYNQKNPVQVDVVSSPGESHVIDGLEVKIRQQERMFAALVRYANDSQAMFGEDRHIKPLELPGWIGEREYRESGSTSPWPDFDPIWCQGDDDSKKCRNGRAMGLPAGHDQKLRLPEWVK